MRQCLGYMFIFSLLKVKKLNNCVELMFDCLGMQEDVGSQPLSNSLNSSCQSVGLAVNGTTRCDVTDSGYHSENTR